MSIAGAAGVVVLTTGAGFASTELGKKGFRPSSGVAGMSNTDLGMGAWSASVTGLAGLAGAAGWGSPAPRLPGAIPSAAASASPKNLSILILINPFVTHPA